MATIKVTLERKNERHTNIEIAKEQVNYLVQRATAGARASWQSSKVVVRDPQMINAKWNYNAVITLERKRPTTPDKMSKEVAEIVAQFNKTGVNKGGWSVGSCEPVDWKMPSGAPAPTDPASPPEGKEFAVEDVVNFDKTLSFEDIVIPEILLRGSDQEIEDHPAFSGIYGRAPHIRVMAASMRTMLATQGLKRNHAVLYGKPACAKSTLFHAWQNVLGAGAFVAINANSATQAGIESIFLDRLPQIGGCPPFLFIEEIEKTNEVINTVWLSIMDERAEIRKVRHNNLRRVEVRSLCFATVNDKVLFDRVMGGRPGSPGALSSRMRGLYVPRPSHNEMKRILMRDIALFYPEGNAIWADKAIEIAHEVGTDDPRMILSFLDGRDRLLTEEYKEDIISIHNREKNDRQTKGDDGLIEDDFEEDHDRDAA
jgi:hypothetical protein